MCGRFHLRQGLPRVPTGPGPDIVFHHSSMAVYLPVSDLFVKISSPLPEATALESLVIHHRLVFVDPPPPVEDVGITTKGRDPGDSWDSSPYAP